MKRGTFVMTISAATVTSTHPDALISPNPRYDIPSVLATHYPFPPALHSSQLPALDSGQQCQRQRIVLIEWIEAFTSCLIIRIVHSWNAMNGKPFTRINVRCSFRNSCMRALRAPNFPFDFAVKIVQWQRNEMEKLIFAFVCAVCGAWVSWWCFWLLAAAAAAIIYSLGTFHICVRSSNFSIGKREWVY